MANDRRYEHLSRVTYRVTRVVVAKRQTMMSLVAMEEHGSCAACALMRLLLPIILLTHQDAYRSSVVATDSAWSSGVHDPSIATSTEPVEMQNPPTEARSRERIALGTTFPGYPRGVHPYDYVPTPCELAWTALVGL
jgi:hypothetical protein